MAVKSKFFIATSKGEWVEANFGGTGSGSFYGDSKENTVNRTATLTNDDGNFELVAGATVNVKFTYASSSGTMTLNVNSTGAKTIKRNGGDTTEWKAGAIINLVYDGTDWIMSSGTDNHYEAFLNWGGQNIVGSISPLDAATSNLHSANRFAFANPNGITIEYSRDGGSNWTVYDTTNASKINLVSGNGAGYAIGGRYSGTTINDKLRITLNATSMNVYTYLRKLLINISTSYATGSNVKIEKAMKGNETKFSLVNTYNISGWSGWNSIPFQGPFGGGSTQTSNVAVIRLTFGITGINSSQSNNALNILDIIAIGDTYWTYPSTMAKTGHLYTYDSSQNATFPAGIKTTGDLILPKNDANYSTSSNSKLIFSNDSTNTEYAALSATSSAFVVNPSTTSTTNQLVYYFSSGQLEVPKLKATTIYENGTSLTNTYLSLSGGTLKGVLTLPSSLYGTSYGMDAKNSDIVNVNGLRLADTTNAWHEGILFPSFDTSGNWDMLYTQADGLYFALNQVPGNRSGVRIATTNDLIDYLPLSGGTLTGALTLPSRASVWGDLTNIAFSSGGKITGNTSGNIGIQGTTSLFFRPTNAATYQMTLDSSGLHPGTSKNISLGTSSYYWNNIYGTTIYENGTSLANKYATVGSRSYLTPQYSISAGNDATHYYKLITITPTSTAYLDLYYEFDVVARSNKYAKIRIYVITSNDNKYISSVYVNSDGALGVDNFKVYKYRDTTNKVDRIEIWCKVTSWDTLKFYPKTSDIPSALSFIWNKTEGTAFPTDATSTITIEKKSWIGNAATATKATQDGSGNVITSTYVKKLDAPTATTPGPVYMTYSNGILTISDTPITT